LEEAGIAFDPLYVLNRTGKGSSGQETGELIMKVMKEDRKADSIITSSDRAAFGAMKALGKVGFYSPEDVKLISFDNSPYSTMASPSITSLDRNPASLAAKACQILLDLIEGKEVNRENIIGVSLVERDSTR
ncbi:MAG: substrate-binding domain-containing protein, partial [Solobacterium sp.]|nr:substrate-binding domain-containing protein [Solobacterium sp.]